MDPITFNIQLTSADLQAFTRYAFGKSLRPTRVILLFIIAVVLVGGAMYLKNPSPALQAPLPRGSSSLPNALYNALPILIFVVAFLFFLRRQLSKTAEKNSPDALLPQILQVTDEGIYSENATSNAMNKWAGVRSLAETKAHYFVMLAPHRGYIIPKRCFTTPDAEAAFGNTIRNFIELKAAD
jgi:hypothetical protein